MLLRHFIARACRRTYATSGGGPKIAIIGSGPAGMYTCSALLSRLPTCQLHIIDKSPAPYGLVSYGVAPDHADMKKCANAFERMFEQNASRVQLFGNVAVGTDVTYEELCQHYDALILAYGASRARTLELPHAESRRNCFSGYSFVSWYNGQPSAISEHQPRLDGEHAVIVGNGNVAIDCARLLLSPAERFRFTDIPDYAYKQLCRSRVRRVSIVGRRGPLEASFTIKELRELLNLDSVDLHCEIDEQHAVLLHERLNSGEIARPRRRLIELMLSRRESSSTAATERRSGAVVFHRRPEAIELDADGERVRALRVRNARDETLEEMACDLLIYAIGFTEFHLPGVPTDAESGGLRLRDSCRVDEERTHVYAAGWCAKAGSGVIADTQRSAALVADEVRDDWARGTLESKASERDIRDLLQRAGVRHVSWRDWKNVDRAEIERGAQHGKPREKIADVLQFLRERESS